MVVKFKKIFDKNCFVFPLCIMWNPELVEYYPTARRLSIYFLWWHCTWTFFMTKKEKK